MLSYRTLSNTATMSALDRVAGWCGWPGLVFPSRGCYDVMRRGGGQPTQTRPPAALSTQDSFYLGWFHHTRWLSWRTRISFYIKKHTWPAPNGWFQPWEGWNKGQTLKQTRIRLEPRTITDQNMTEYNRLRQTSFYRLKLYCLVYWGDWLKLEAGE